VIPDFLPSSTKQVRYASSTSSPEQLRKTPLYDLHVKHGGKMVPFGGYYMPVQYNDLSIVESHLWTRSKASLFDVSHMVQHHFSGSGAAAFLSRLTPAGLSSLSNHQSTLSVFLHPETGGIVDDTIITRIGPNAFYVVTNAGCREKDLAYLTSNLDALKQSEGLEVKWDVLEDQGLIALQGPLAPQILSALVTDNTEDDLTKIHFGQSKYIRLRLATGAESQPVLISRGGYTGEDGFEISVAPSDVVPLTEFLLQTAGPEQLRLAGLGPRDSLRLEAGMCLYGHDLDDTVTPVEAALGWVIGKDRRENGGFNGSDIVLAQLKPKREGGMGTTRRRIGLLVEGAPAREGTKLVDTDGNEIGVITSGCPSPSLKKNIAMGYVKTGYNKIGTEVFAVVRGKQRKATVTKMPFLPSKYWKGGVSPA